MQKLLLFVRYITVKII